jgi:subtilisin family serine protease
VIKLLSLLFTISLFAQVPNFEYLQKYLEPAPVGIDAMYAWTVPGGTGENIKIIDIESGITLYKDLSKPFVLNSLKETNHGSAVLGTLVAKNDGKGTTGIVYDAQWGFFSKFFHGFKKNIKTPLKVDYDLSLSKTIDRASSLLERGDVLIIEVQVIGAKKKFVPAEYWPSTYKALRRVTNKGIHCVAAAGNGGHNLDDKAYRRFFKLRYRDSGCIIVGAVTLEPTSDNRGHIKTESSNYGSRIDVHGYGKNVATVGYGDLFSDDKGVKYTRFFGGTSSATAIVSGAVAAVSSIEKDQKRRITTQRMRRALRRTGTPSYDQNNRYLIGNLPDIKQMLYYLKLD